MNDIELWSNANIVDTTNKFINAIKLVDANQSLQGALEWKNYDNQVVIKTNKYYYKVYTIDQKSDKFFEKVREKLAEIYRNLFGIHWIVKTIECNDIYYQVEQREVLNVCNPTMISFEELLLNWSKTLDILEEKLKFNIITKEIQQIYPDVHKLKIIRDCVNKFPDYAMTNNGDIVLLDDSDWFIAMVDKDGNWLSKKPIVVDIVSIIGESFFAPITICSGTSPSETMTDKEVTKWNIFNPNVVEKPNLNLLKSNRETMLEENIKLLSLGKIEKKLSLVDYRTQGCI